MLAITYAEGSRTGGLQPWIGMGSAKAALESMVRHFAVAVARRGTAATTQAAAGPVGFERTARSTRATRIAGTRGLTRNPRRS